MDVLFLPLPVAHATTPSVRGERSGLHLDWLHNPDGPPLARLRLVLCRPPLDTACLSTLLPAESARPLLASLDQAFRGAGPAAPSHPAVPDEGDCGLGDPDAAAFAWRFGPGDVVALREHLEPLPLAAPPRLVVIARGAWAEPGQGPVPFYRVRFMPLVGPARGSPIVFDADEHTLVPFPAALAAMGRKEGFTSAGS